MKKRILTVLLVAMLTSTMLNACGNNQTSNTNTNRDDVIVEAGDRTTDKNKQEEPTDYFTQMGFELSPNLGTIYKLVECNEFYDISTGEYTGEKLEETQVSMFFEKWKDETGEPYSWYEGCEQGNVHVIWCMDEVGGAVFYQIALFDKYTGTLFKEGTTTLEIDGKSYEINCTYHDVIENGFTTSECAIYYTEGYDGFIVAAMHGNADLETKSPSSKAMLLHEIECYDEIKDRLVFFSFDNEEKYYPDAPDLIWEEYITGISFSADKSDGHIGFEKKTDEDGISYLIYQEDGTIYYPGDVVPGGCKWIGDNRADREYANQRLSAE